MTSSEFFTAVDVLTLLTQEQQKALAALNDLNNEISAVMREVWELIFEAQRELDTPDGRRYTLDLRIFNGYGDEERDRLTQLFLNNGFTVKT